MSTIKIITIVGARPQFVKAAMVSRAILNHNKNAVEVTIEEKILHTGQHYDINMSQIFFDDLCLPKPAWTLSCSNMQPQEMSEVIEEEIKSESPDYVLLYGDTNSTLAGALAASKLHIPIIHVEAGLRSYNNNMPEERNRIATDKLSSMLMCPTRVAIRNLSAEGIDNNVYWVGDVMYDAALLFAQVANKKSTIMKQLDLTHKRFILATIHRAENTNDKQKLKNILIGLSSIANATRPIVWPMHPRTMNIISSELELSALIVKNENIIITEPIGYLDMVVLEREAMLIMTDSGGVQKEAYFHRTPCVTLREETEWVETVEAGWNYIVGTNPDRIKRSLVYNYKKRAIDEYGDGASAEKIIEIICRNSY